MTLPSKTTAIPLKIIALTLALVAALPLAAQPRRSHLLQPGAIYINTNQIGGNNIVAIRRGFDGLLTPLQTISTGGKGTAGPTESQDSVVLNDDHTLLFTVNVASNDISVFSVDQQTFELTLVQRIASGGDRPVELAVHNNLLYVANSGLRSGISGFGIGAGGTLTPIPGSIKPFSFGDGSPFGDVTLPCTSIFPALEKDVTCSATQPADIRFTPDGRHLIVSERLVNQFSVFDIDANGVAGERESRTSAGESPFGIDFDNKGRMFVAEAFLDRPNQGALSSYTIAVNGTTQTITSSLKTGQSTGCWIAITPNGRFAYMTNPGAGTISGFNIMDNGQLQLIKGQGTVATSHDPRDESITPNGRFLYTINNSVGSVNGYLIQADGALTQITTTGEGAIPRFGQGLAAF